MLTLIKKIFSENIKTEKILKKESSVEKIGEALSCQIKKRFSRALAIRMVDAGSCNACELEIQAINNPYYNIEQYGIHFVASPRHADLLLVTGPVTKNMKEALIKTYEAMPDPKFVIAIGDCAFNCGVFKNSNAIAGSVNDIIPVNYSVKGCPPTPGDIMQSILCVLK